MSGRVVLFGATGFTGRLTAAALVRRGVRPVLAGRDRDALLALADSLGGGEVAVADASDPATVRALVDRGDALVTTVGPFTTYGAAALRAAVESGAWYVDSTGEPGFLRRVFDEWGPRAAAGDTGLAPGFGYDYVPGNVAGALAVRAAGQAAVRIDVGYFVTGRMEPSAGTLASLAASRGEPGYRFRDGRLVAERAARSVRSFAVGGRPTDAISIGGSEHVALPRFAPWLREVNVYIGWFGAWSRAVSAGVAVVERMPLADRVARAMLRALPMPATGDGPDAAARRASGSHVVAIAYDAAGVPLGEVRLVGDNGYDVTAGLLAWAGATAAARGLRGTGALGPVDAFGLDAVLAAVEAAGLRVVST